MEHIPNITVLFIGRILGGISTNLLFSAFESWMVAEHRKLGFSEPLLQSTFVVSSWGNGLVAIGAGFIAQWSVTTMGYGDIGPFQVAILLTVVCLILILFFWGENYGETSRVNDSGEVDCNVSEKLSINIEDTQTDTPLTSPSSPLKSPIRKSPRLAAAARKNGDNSSIVSPISNSASPNPNKTKKNRTKNIDTTIAATSSITASTGSSDDDQHHMNNEVKSMDESSTSSRSNNSISSILRNHPEICLLGLSQACFEGAVYSFGKLVYY